MCFVLLYSFGGMDLVSGVIWVIFMVYVFCVLFVVVWLVEFVFVCVLFCVYVVLVGMVLIGYFIIICDFDEWNCWFCIFWGLL